MSILTVEGRAIAGDAMTGAAAAIEPERRSLAHGLLGAAGVFWLSVALIGQWAFFYYIASFYGVSTFSGEFEVWNRLSALGRTPYVAGDAAGNMTYAAHALAAGVIAFGGALQLIPQIRTRWPVFHRWNGRLFLVTVVGLSLSGFYLVWVRHTSPDQLNALSTTFNGILILGFTALALRAALARDFAVHRRWAMRLYLVSNAQWFLRVGLFSYFIVNRALGNAVSMGDPFLLFWVPGCYLVPLAVLECYLRASESGGALVRSIVAAGVIALTVLMGIGILGFAMFSQAMISGAPLALPN